MVNAGRILIMPRGDWDNLTTYDMLDLVSYDDVAYLARQQSVGINPSTDTSLTYWQPFGSASSIATTTTPGLVMPDGTTITIDVDGRIEVPIDNSTIKIDELTGKLIAVVTPTAAGTSYSNTTSGLIATNVQAAIDEVVTDLNGKADASDIPTALSQLTDDSTHRVVTDTEKSTWNAKPSTTDVNNKHKVTSKQVDTTGWTSDTTSQSGTTLYKKTISLSHVYVDSPSVDIGASGVLPTTAQQEAYNLLQYVTINGTTLTLYASAIPSTSFYINIEGVD